MKFDKLIFQRKKGSVLLENSKLLVENLKKRRSVRDFSVSPVPIKAIENAVQIALSSPSGANKEPWTFAIVTDKKIKKEIRKAAETEEKKFYRYRATKEWLVDLSPFNTNWKKPFLEKAPCLIVVFKQVYDCNKKKNKKNYYVNESVGISTGFLLMALHQIGLVALAHTPSPMGFLEKILFRPKNERAFLLVPTGFPAKNTKVPKLKKKSFSESVVKFY